MQTPFKVQECQISLYVKRYDPSEKGNSYNSNFKRGYSSGLASQNHGYLDSALLKINEMHPIASTS